MASIESGEIELEAPAANQDSYDSTIKKSRSLRFSTSNRFEEYGIAWKCLNKSVTYVLNDVLTEKQILFDVSGAAAPGEVVALMGPSGSGVLQRQHLFCCPINAKIIGKTTLLNVLAGRALAHVTGDILVNGKKFSKAIRKRIAYVMQVVVA